MHALAHTTTLQRYTPVTRAHILTITTHAVELRTHARALSLSYMRNVVISYAHMQDVSYVSSPWLPQNLRYTSKPMRSMAHRYLASWLIPGDASLESFENWSIIGIPYTTDVLPPTVRTYQEPRTILSTPH